MNRRQAIITAILAAMYQLVPMRSGVAHAVRDGLWSDRRTWRHGLFPCVTDLVFANGCRVIVDRDIEAKELRSDGAHGARDGGTFIVSESRRLYVNGVCGGKTSPAVSIVRSDINVTVGPRNPPPMQANVRGCGGSFTIRNQSTLA